MITERLSLPSTINHKPSTLLKRAGSTASSALPARAISTKIKHLLVISRSQPAVSRRLFRCLGAHLLRSPSTVNPGQIHGTCLVATGGHTPPAENLGSPTSQFVLAFRTSARCRVLSHSPCRSCRSLVSVSLVHRENKKRRSPSVSRAGKESAFHEPSLPLGRGRWPAHFQA